MNKQIPRRTAAAVAKGGGGTREGKGMTMRKQDHTFEIVHFLCLPPEALPSAQWKYGDDAVLWGDPWPMLRAAVASDHEIGAAVLLTADRDEWQPPKEVWI